jgi:hypothetical protein
VKNKIKLALLLALATLASCGGGSGSSGSSSTTTQQFAGFDAIGQAWRANYSSETNALVMSRLDLNTDQVVETQTYSLKKSTSSAKAFDIEQLPGFSFGIGKSGDSVMAAVKAPNNNGGTSIMPAVLNSTVLQSLDEIAGTYAYALPFSISIPSTTGGVDQVITSPGYNLVVNADGSTAFNCIAQNANDQATCDQLKYSAGVIKPLTSNGWWSWTLTFTDTSVAPAVTRQAQASALFSRNATLRHAQFGKISASCNDPITCITRTFTSPEAAAVPSALAWTGKWLMSRESVGSLTTDIKEAPVPTVTQITGAFGRSLTLNTDFYTLGYWRLTQQNPVDYGGSYKLLPSSILYQRGLYIAEFSEFGISALFNEDPNTLPLQTVRIPGNGTSGPYLLNLPQSNIVSGTDKVSLVVLDRNTQAVLNTTVLHPYVDYSYDPFSGKLLFPTPIANVDANLNPIVVEFSAKLLPSNTSPLPATLGIRIE